MKGISKELEREIVNENFRIARSKIQSILGIKLQLGELVELRKDIESVHDFYFKDSERFGTAIGGDKHSIKPDDEAAIIFMNRNYGTQFNDLRQEDVDKFYSKRIEAFNLSGYDYYLKYFRKVQEEMHLP